MLLASFGGTGSQGGAAAQAIDLDGTNDYLSKAADFTGNADGKTFTFSAWVRVNDTSNSPFIYDADGKFGVYISSAGGVQMVGKNAAGTNVLFAGASSLLSSIKDTHIHLLISIDLANAANRYVYVNDADVTSSFTWTTYTNDNIDFTVTNHYVGNRIASSAPFKGRLAHLYLDYQYRDLSSSANRRYFITADRKPVAKASVAALNPILYLPMDDPSTAHVNLGTGGNFTLNGTIARSGRGPNQFNAAYSDLDGAADYLSRTSITGLSDGKVFTFAASLSVDTAAASNYLFVVNTGVTARFYIHVNTDKIHVVGSNAAGSTILNAQATLPTIAMGRNHHVVMSIDLADTAKRHIVIDGAAATVTWTTYTNDTIDFVPTTSPNYNVGADGAGSYYNGKLGNVFFHTSYIDLSVAANLAKFVTGTGIDAKPADLGASGELPLGTSPLIYLPMYGNNAGKNYGTGGDFTVNSGPFTGARGPNEFFGNKADFNGTDGVLARTSALTGAVDGNKFSASFWINSDSVTGVRTIFKQNGGVGVNRGVAIYSSGTTLYFLAYDSSGSSLMAVGVTFTLSTATDYFVQACFDLSDSAKRHVYINGTSYVLTASPYTNGSINFSCSGATIGNGGTTNYFDGRMAEFLFTTEYIDFSQEANRLKFRDAFGNPTNIPAAITAGTITNPLIYMRFDPSNKGANAGYGGNFTPAGTISDGGQL